MKNKAIWIVILILLIAGIIIINIYFKSYFAGERKEPEETEFSFNVSTVDSRFTNEPYFIEIKGHRAVIRQKFSKPSPCNSVNYTITKDNFTIDVIPEDISHSGGGCIAVIGADFVEINLILSDRNYTINMYSWWNKTSPFFSKEIMIGKEDNQYEKCMNETTVPGEYVKGEVLIDFKEGVTENERQDFEMNFAASVYADRHYDTDVVKVPEGKELEWMCKLKDYTAVKDTRLLEISYPE